MKKKIFFSISAAYCALSPRFVGVPDRSRVDGRAPLLCSLVQSDIFLFGPDLNRSTSKPWLPDCDLIPLDVSRPKEMHLSLQLQTRCKQCFPPFSVTNIVHSTRFPPPFRAFAIDSYVAFLTKSPKSPSDAEPRPEFHMSTIYFRHKKAASLWCSGFRNKRSVGDSIPMPAPPFREPCIPCLLLHSDLLLFLFCFFSKFSFCAIEMTYRSLSGIQCGNANLMAFGTPFTIP